MHAHTRTSVRGHIHTDTLHTRVRAHTHTHTHTHTDKFLSLSLPLTESLDSHHRQAGKEGDRAHSSYPHKNPTWGTPVLQGLLAEQFPDQISRRGRAPRSRGQQVHQREVQDASHLCTTKLQKITRNHTNYKIWRDASHLRTSYNHEDTVRRVKKSQEHSGLCADTDEAFEVRGVDTSPQGT